MEKSFIYNIRNEQDFYVSYKSANKCSHNLFVLKNDIVFHNKKKVYLPKSIVISGNDHSIYYSQDCSFEGSFMNTTLVPYRDVIKIKKAEDLEKIRTIKNGTIVVEILKDIENYSMDSIMLNHFVGSLIILGNKHEFNNLKITGEDYNGLFGRIPSCSSLKIKDLTLNHVVLSHDKASYAGFLLGVHSTHPDRFIRDVCNPVIIKNCEIINSHMDYANKGMGIIMGNFNEELFVRDLYINNNRRAGNVLLKSLVGEQEIFNGYYYESLENHGPVLKRKKS